MSYQLVPVVAWVLLLVACTWVATGLAGCREESHAPYDPCNPTPVSYHNPSNLLPGILPSGEALEPGGGSPGTIVPEGTITLPIAQRPYHQYTPVAQERTPSSPAEGANPEALAKEGNMSKGARF